MDKLKSVYGEVVVEQVKKYLMYYKELIKQKVKEGDVRYIDTMDICFDKYYSITKAVTRNMLGMSLEGHELIDVGVVEELTETMSLYMLSREFGSIKEDILAREAFLGYAMYLLNLYKDSGLPLEIVAQ